MTRAAKQPDDASPARQSWVVDSLGEETATVEVDGAATQKVPRWLLPDGAREGSVLAVTVTRSAERVAVTVEQDESATKAALEASEEQMREAPVDRQAGDIAL